MSESLAWIPRDESKLSESHQRGRLGWKEGVAAAGVILSLTFVAVELSQNTKAIEATVRNDLASASREWTLALATSPEATAAMLKWEAEEEMTPVEERMVIQLAVGVLRNTENVYLQVQNGSVEESALIGYGFQGIPLMRATRFFEWWSVVRGNWHPDFVEAFEGQNSYLKASDP
jgi:hypothetical protein